MPRHSIIFAAILLMRRVAAYPVPMSSESELTVIEIAALATGVPPGALVSHEDLNSMEGAHLLPLPNIDSTPRLTSNNSARSWGVFFGIFIGVTVLLFSTWFIHKYRETARQRATTPSSDRSQPTASSFIAWSRAASVTSEKGSESSRSRRADPHGPRGAPPPNSASLPVVYRNSSGYYSSSGTSTSSPTTTETHCASPAPSNPFDDPSRVYKVHPTITHLTSLTEAALRSLHTTSVHTSCSLSTISTTTSIHTNDSSPPRKRNGRAVLKQTDRSPAILLTTATPMSSPRKRSNQRNGF